MENREYYESIKTERAARAVIAAIAVFCIQHGRAAQ